MYEEEFFAALVPKEGGELEDALVYKYYSTLEPKEFDQVQQAMISNQTVNSQRGVLLGVPIPYQNQWLPHQAGHFSCLLKTYDDHSSTLKLNEAIEVVGVLEF